MDAWMQDGAIVNMQPWFESSKGYDSAGAPVRAFMAYGVDTRRGGFGSGAPGRAVLAALAVPVSGPQPSPTSATVIEFYNAGLDHFHHPRGITYAVNIGNSAEVSCPHGEAPQWRVSCANNTNHM
jgi:hypothetical protein